MSSHNTRKPCKPNWQECHVAQRCPAHLVLERLECIHKSIKVVDASSIHDALPFFFMRCKPQLVLSQRSFLAPNGPLAALDVALERHLFLHTQHMVYPRPAMCSHRPQQRTSSDSSPLCNS